MQEWKSTTSSRTYRGIGWKELMEVTDAVCIVVHYFLLVDDH